VINYGRNDETSDVTDDQNDVIAAAPRRSTTQVRHGGPLPTALRLPSPQRGPRGTAVVTVEDEVRGRCVAPPRQNGRRTVGRHYSGGYCTAGVQAGALLVLPHCGPPTTTTVTRRRHRSDDRRTGALRVYTNLAKHLITDKTSYSSCVSQKFLVFDFRLF